MAFRPCLVLFVFLVCGSVCDLRLHMGVLGAPAVPAPRFQVNLDLAPELRWTHVIEYFKDKYGPIVAFLDSFLPVKDQKLLEPIVDDIETLFPAPYAAEIRGIAAAANGSLTLGQVAVMNIVYDLTAACTSIVANDPHSLGVAHARNLDYSIPGLRNITADIVFVKGGVVQYYTTVFAGYVGALTGMRPGSFAVSVDQRTVSGDTILNNLYEVLIRKAHGISFMLRSELDAGGSFSSAEKFIANVRLMAPVYITVSGPARDNGVVITRDYESANLWALNQANGTWYRLETNYDHWKPTSDPRRAVGNKAMEELGPEGVSLDGLYKVLSTHPVLNAGTKYTTFMNTKQGVYQTWVRYDGK